ncbi:uncharacterized protein LOC133204128 [Saccostrea echinata]|uniref:uncharacterized protein LOC133204128 n=1 Tax=Saccostrea echinata TaxID=191078 RepID=UPI002A81EFE9|nr:uncharacterized protein LOC133204128 [Saccostrea echinata]
MAFQNCPATKITLSFTKCPSTEKSWMEAAKKKNCSSIPQNCTSPENFRYHCVANAFMNQTIEVCAPGLYLLGYCPEYNFQGERIQDNYNADCKNFAEPCPSRYKSWMSYKYSDCVALKKFNHGIQLNKLYKSDLNKTALEINLEMKEGREFVSADSVIIFVCISSVFLAVLVGFVIYLFRCAKGRRKPETSSGGMEQEPLNHITSNGNFS